MSRAPQQYACAVSDVSEIKDDFHFGGSVKPSYVRDDGIRSSIITGKALERYFELDEALAEFSRLFDYGEKIDRAIAIVGATFLEMVLEHILRAYLVDDEEAVGRLLEYDQPLGNFSRKTALVYCLGLIYKPVRDDLDLVRRIRNRFAHDLYASFEDEQVKSWCSALRWHRIAYVENPPSDATARDLFQVGVNQLVTYLNGVVGIARAQKRQVGEYS